MNGPPSLPIIGRLLAFIILIGWLPYVCAELPPYVYKVIEENSPEEIGIEVVLGTNSLRDEDRRSGTPKLAAFAPLSWLKLDGW